MPRPSTVRSACEDTGGEVKATTANGPISVVLNGTMWDGDGLDARATNGPLTLEVPDDYASGVEVSMSRRSPVSCRSPLCPQEWRERSLDHSSMMALGSGPVLVRLGTINGPVDIHGPGDDRPAGVAPASSAARQTSRRSPTAYRRTGALPFLAPSRHNGNAERLVTRRSLIVVVMLRRQRGGSRRAERRRRAAVVRCLARGCPEGSRRSRHPAGHRHERARRRHAGGGRPAARPRAGRVHPLVQSLSPPAADEEDHPGRPAASAQEYRTPAR